LKELNDINLKKALTVLEVMNFTEEERMIYQGHLDWLRIEISALKKQEMKGRIEGKIEGKQEALMSFIKNLINENEPIERIAKLTGLSIKEVEKIKKEMNK
jgi:predicted transposase/invertase (TIGR01784 family)